MVFFCTTTLRSRPLALACLGVALFAFGLSVKDEPSLHAASNAGRNDLDRDGLTDLQELVIGTLPYERDSDFDGFSDLEERARVSDPSNAASIPEPTEFSLGTCASQEDGYVSVVSVIYVDGTQLADLDLDIGFVFRGRQVIATGNIQTYSRSFLYRAADVSDTLAVIEVGIPEGLVRRLGQVSMWTRIRDSASVVTDPFVSIITLVDFAGVVMAVEPTLMRATNTEGGGTGVVYRPLVVEDQLSSNEAWTSNRMCFQRTSAVGMTGVSIMHEVDRAECIEMDTYCNTAACSAGAGSTLVLPDPAALAGG